MKRCVKIMLLSLVLIGAILLLKSNVYAAPISDIEFNFDSARDTMMQYIVKDKTKVKIINNAKLYSYDVKSGDVSEEYTFPIAERCTKSGIEIYYASQTDVYTYIDEKNGKLYYGYNEYNNTFSNDEIVKVVVYDLEKSEVNSTFEVSGHILNAIGVDKNGNIFIGTDDSNKDGDNWNRSCSIIVLSSAGKKLCEKKVENPVNSFAGFCSDGTFYIVDECAQTSYGYTNTMGRLVKANFNNNKITVNSIAMFNVKNIMFANYSIPVEILNDKYLTTFSGMFMPLSKITEDSYSTQLYAQKKLEQGGDYSYIFSSGVNSVIDGDDVYTLYDNDTIFVYSMSSGKKLKYYNTPNKIFNMKKAGDDLYLLETDGTKFYYQKIAKTKFKKIKTKTYNMNNFNVYADRTKDDIVAKFNELAPKNMDATLYKTTASTTNPYKSATLTAETKKNAINISNYYRWLAGLKEFEASSNETWDKAAKGAVLLSVSNFDHSPQKPNDMDEDFYNEALAGTSRSSIAGNYYDKQYKIYATIRQWMNDNGDQIPGHRTNFLTRNGNKIAYGMSTYYACQTVEFQGDPNPAGTASIANNEAAYAWPAPGNFPSEELSTSAYWTVNLNTDKVKLSNIGATVTVENLDTGKKFKRTTSADGLTSTSNWGVFLCFAPPSDANGTYAGKNYKVTIDNLCDEDGLPANLVYTVKFFSYKDNVYTINNKKYRCDQYGQLTKLKNISSKESKLQIEYTAITYTGDKLKPKVKIKGLTKGVDYRVKYSNNKNPGIATVKIVGIGNYKGSITKTFKIKPSKVKIKSSSTKNKSVTLNWKKVKGATGYQVFVATSKNGEYKKIKNIKDVNTVTYTKKGLKKNKVYYFKVRAYWKNGEEVIYGERCNVVKIKVK